MLKEAIWTSFILAAVSLPGYADNNNNDNSGDNNNQEPEVIYEPEYVPDPVFIGGYDEGYVGYAGDVYIDNGPPCSGHGDDCVTDEKQDRDEDAQQHQEQFNEDHDDYGGYHSGGGFHGGGGGRR